MPIATPTHERDRAGKDADLDRDAQPVEDCGQQIPALRVGAEQVDVAVGRRRTPAAAARPSGRGGRDRRVLRRDERGRQQPYRR